MWELQKVQCWYTLFTNKKSLVAHFMLISFSAPCARIAATHWTSQMIDKLLQFQILIEQ